MEPLRAPLVRTSNPHPLDFVERHFVRAAVVDLGGAGVVGHGGGLLQRAAVFETGGDAGGAEGVVAGFGCKIARIRLAPLNRDPFDDVAGDPAPAPVVDAGGGGAGVAYPAAAQSMYSGCSRKWRKPWLQRKEVVKNPCKSGRF